MTTHEPVRSHRKVTVGSDRNFGIVFAAVFVIVGLGRLHRDGTIRWWAIAIAAVFLVCAFAAPHLLRPLNNMWFKLGLLLHNIVNPIVMGVLYFGAVVPMGLVIRLLGKDLLQLNFDRAANSYWIKRDAPAPRPGGMTKQF